jgi:hypothetical protein
VRARIDGSPKVSSYGETMEVEEASADRRRSRSVVRRLLYGHIAYPRQLAIKAQVIEDAFRRIGRLTLPSLPGVAASPEDGYRMRARLARARRPDRVLSRGNARRLRSSANRQLLPATCETIEALEQTFGSLGLDAIREIDLSENVDASERVVFVDAASADRRAGDRRRWPTRRADRIASRRFGSSGSSSVVDRVTVADGVEVALRRHVLAFFQGNRHLLASFVAHVVGLVTDVGRLLDLYAGVGLFAVVRRRRVASRSRRSKADRVAAPIWRATRRPRPGRSWRCISRRGFRPAAAPRVALPPPSSPILHAPACQRGARGIVAHQPARVDLRVVRRGDLARDARRLVDAGYAIARIDAFDLFPNTPHVETVVVFDSASRRTADRLRQGFGAQEALRRIYLVWAASRKPSKSGRNSPVRKKFSGCH